MDLSQAGVLTRKLSQLGPLSVEEQRLIDDLPVNVRDVGSDIDLVRERERSESCLVLLEGFCCRYKMLADGRRQIVSFNIPGDFLDLPRLILDRSDHNVGTLTPVRVGSVPRRALAELSSAPNLWRLLWLDTLLDAAIYSEWVLNIGRRNARQRVAHLLCELITRLRAVGLAESARCDLPITQGELADATGLSTVHVNRVVQELRREGLIAMKGRNFTALNWDRLTLAAGFDASYLQLPTATADRPGVLGD